MESSEKDIKVRKAAAWRACGKLHKIWNSTLPTKFKHRLFAATVESVLLYGCEAWTITSKLSKDLDGCYTRLHRTAFNVHWKQHMTTQQLYGDSSKITNKIRERRLRFAGHFCRSCDETVSRLLLWNPTHGKRTPGRPSLTCKDQLRLDTGLEASDMRTVRIKVGGGPSQFGRRTRLKQASTVNQSVKVSKVSMVNYGIGASIIINVY